MDSKLIIILIYLLKVNQILSSTSNYIFPCYYFYEPQNLATESIPPIDLCTHIILIGCVGEHSNETIVRYHTSPFDCSIVLKKLHLLKYSNPDLKLLISIATNSDIMHEIVQNNESMHDYAESAISLVLNYDYDGIDFDWEYPCGDDKFKFTQLLEIFRNKISKLNLNHMILTAAIGAGLKTINECFDLNGLTANLDYINVMCYDYNTIFNTYTAYSSPLFARPEEIGYDATLNSNFTINYLIDNKVPRSKIVLGLNAGGHTFQLKNPAKNGFHADVLGVGYSQGWSLYPQLCQLAEQGTAVYDEVAQVLYAYYDDQWTNTGDIQSAQAKSKWAKQMKLAGVFTWCLNWDDLFNLCKHNVTFPIHRAIRKELFSLN